MFFLFLDLGTAFLGRDRFAGESEEMIGLMANIICILFSGVSYVFAQC